MAGFCSNCGSPLGEGTAFCGSCGARVAAPPQAASPAPPAKGGNLFLKIVALVLGFFALVTVVGIGSCIYIGYRVKRKAESFTSDLKKQVGRAREETKPENTVTVQPCPPVDPAQSQAFRTAASSTSIPLKPGLVLVDVYTNQQLGGRDVEVLKSVQAIDNNTVTIRAAKTEPGSSPSSRILCVADLLNARQYVTGFGTNTPETIPGTTMFTMSQAVFHDWKATQQAGLTYFSAAKSGSDRYRVESKVEGALSRVEPNDVPYQVIVNGERQDLPTIHVKGKLGGNDAEAYVLDDPANPITLKWMIPAWNFHLTYLKITFPVEKKIEQDLVQHGCAAVYGIYFDFGSAGLRSESGPALKEIADALRDNPAWKVKIDGHTDNVGGDPYNMGLSTRRAAAVAQALVARYQVSSSRLSSEGFGAQKPKASNDTPEGRALNRRVELCRQ
jgi:hypothetical protein